MTRTILWLAERPPTVSIRRQFFNDYVMRELEDVTNVVYRRRVWGKPTPPDHNIAEIVSYWRLPLGARVSPRIPWHLLTRRYDVAVSNTLGSFPTICAFLVGGLIRRKPFVIMTENWYPKRSRVVNTIHRWVAQHAALVVAQSTKAYRYTVDVLEVGESRVVKCVNTISDVSGLDFDEPTLEVLRHDATTKAICVARFVPVKGQDLLIKAFRSLDLPNTKLILIGNYETPFGRTCMELARGDVRIEFVGHIEFERVLAYYRGADVFVMSNRFSEDRVEGAESFGFAILEAAWFGLPTIVTTATGCADDLVTHGVSGFEVRAGDIEGLRESLCKFLSDPIAATKAGFEAAKRAHELCTPEVVSDFKEAFERLLDQSC